MKISLRSRHPNLPNRIHTLPQNLNHHPIFLILLLRLPSLYIQHRLKLQQMLISSGQRSNKIQIPSYIRFNFPLEMKDLPTTLTILERVDVFPLNHFCYSRKFLFSVQDRQILRKDMYGSFLEHSSRRISQMSINLIPLRFPLHNKLIILR